MASSKQSKADILERELEARKKQRAFREMVDDMYNGVLSGKSKQEFLEDYMDAVYRGVVYELKSREESSEQEVEVEQKEEINEQKEAPVAINENSVSSTSPLIVPKKEPVAKKVNRFLNIVNTFSKEDRAKLLFLFDHGIPREKELLHKIKERVNSDENYVQNAVDQLQNMYGSVTSEEMDYVLNRDNTEDEYQQEETYVEEQPEQQAPIIANTYKNKPAGIYNRGFLPQTDGKAEVDVVEATRRAYLESPKTADKRAEEALAEMHKARDLISSRQAPQQKRQPVQTIEYNRGSKQTPAPRRPAPAPAPAPAPVNRQPTNVGGMVSR